MCVVISCGGEYFFCDWVKDYVENGLFLVDVSDDYVLLWNIGDKVGGVVDWIGYLGIFGCIFFYIVFFV